MLKALEAIQLRTQVPDYQTLHTAFICYCIFKAQVFEIKP